jgi:hypothetical protein
MTVTEVGRGRKNFKRAGVDDFISVVGTNSFAFFKKKKKEQKSVRKKRN